MKSINIFEIRGSEVNTEIDMFILDIHKKNPNIIIKKIDVMDKNSMKGHKDVVQILKTDGIDPLPLIKVDKKIVNQEAFESMIRKVL